MPSLSTTHVRFGSLILGLAALLLTVFPLIRPFFPMDLRAPADTLAAASPVITSAPWVVSHLLCTLAFVLLLYGVLTLYTHLAHHNAESQAFRAMVLSLAGIALILPMLGVETYILPILGKLYLAGHTGITPAISMIYLGPALGVFLVGLLLLAIGAITFAVTVRRDSSNHIPENWVGNRRNVPTLRVELRLASTSPRSATTLSRPGVRSNDWLDSPHSEVV